MEFTPVLEAFGLNKDATVLPVKSGLINHTWRIEDGRHNFILQRINQQVFSNPADIHFNIKLISTFLKNKFPDYKLVTPLPDLSGEDLFKYEEDQFRLFEFVPFSHTINTVNTPEQAYEAALKFGQLTAYLNEFDASKLKVIIPGFHDLGRRVEDFKNALQNGNQERIKTSEKIINELLGYQDITDKYIQIKKNPEFKLRVMHHDTKISNVLFDEKDKGIAVIDLDTLMPGYFISDAGDMMRTYLSPVNEEEADTDKIVIRKDYYNAISEGYAQFMRPILSKDEWDSFFYAGKFMIYMQAIRFMTDHINNDRYYGAAYEGHNLVRATNQLVLLNRYNSFSS